MTRNRGSRAANVAKGAVADSMASGDAASTRVADVAAGKSSERSRSAMSRVPLLLRMALFVLACVFAVLGVKGFLDATEVQSTSRLVTTESIQGQPVRHALVLFSYDDSDAFVAQERSGVLGVLGRSGVSSDVFYLDARTGSEDVGQAGALSDSITAKAQVNGGYDVIVTAGDDALSYILDNQVLFGGIPVSFFAVDDAQLAQRAYDEGLASGYVEADAAKLSLEVSSALLPEAGRAVVLVDGSMESEGLFAQLNGASGTAGSVALDVWDASALTRDELADQVGRLGSDSFVLLLAANRDAEGIAYTPTETAYFLGANASVPVFSALGGVGEGVCGASFVNREAEGGEAAKLAIELVNGAQVQSKPVQRVSAECSVFDAQALEEHGIDPGATPADASLVNESAFSWRVVRPFVAPVLFMLAAVACIAAFGVIGFRRSIKSNKAIIDSRDELQHRLYHDLLTDLPNRHALDQFVGSASSEGGVRSVVQVDVNDFTDINDSYGHAFGDEVIKVIAMRLKRVNAEFLARSGGDEFTLAFGGPLEASSPELLQVERIFHDPVIVGDDKVDATATIGVANRAEGMTAGDLIVFSDLAMNHGKYEGIRQPVFYTQDMRDNMERKIEIVAHLKRAIADESIVVLWQPQVSTEDLSVYGYEALCRLQGNEYPPGDFIPVAEMSGLVNPLDRIVTKKVVEQLGAWLKQGCEHVGVASINFSAAQLRDKGYCDFLAELLAENGVPASLLKIEITESMLIGNEEEADRLFMRLRAMGVSLALDDFGTGYSSLHRMASRPVDVVKLDKSLVDTFMVEGKSGFIDDVAKLIHGLGKSIVVEGVETYEQYQMSLSAGCDVIQGYFFARPLPADEAIAFDPAAVMAEVRAKANDKTRNGNWHKYDRDEHGRWTKKR